MWNAPGSWHGSSSLLCLTAGIGTATALALLWRRLCKLESTVANSSHPVHKPDMIILLRHGESEANVDHQKYGDVGDPNVSLTEDGRLQAIAAGSEIAKLVGDRPLFVFVSPYARTRQTAEAVHERLVESGTRLVQWREDPRIREREFSGSFQRETVCRKDENSYSRFFWRPPSGESCADVYDRVSLFMDTLWRTMFSHQSMEGGAVLVVSHGLTNRLFLMRWLHWPVERFSSSRNQENATYLVLTRNTRRGLTKAETPPPENVCHPTPWESTASALSGGDYYHDYYRLTSDSLRQLGFESSEAANAAAESQPEAWTAHHPPPSSCSQWQECVSTQLGI
mmetsp:Transcript_53718/g.107891  ORF Transcript_53718/g.107891 Transcript_53718/m.107891 type:complete len:339 (+) Transcript_53718:170-1186(+)